MLIIIPWFPYPLNSGGNQAICNGIRALSKTYELCVLYIDYSPSCHKSFQENLKNELDCDSLIGVWDYRILFSELKRRLFGTILDYKYCDLLKFREYPKSIFKKINDIVLEKNIDCVQIEMFDALSLVDCLPQNVKKVFVHHEIRYLLGKQIVPFCKNGNSFRKKLDRERAEEISYLNKYDMVVTLSKADKDCLVGDGLTSPCVESLAIVKSDNLKFREEKRSELKLTFVGPEQHLPNKNGLFWFLENCWADLLSNGDYSLEVIGAWSKESESVLTKNYSNIHFCGFVDNLGAALKGSIMIVPIFEGSGIRMKILESAQLGVPFVSTSVGCMGLLFENRKHCYIADDAKEFVSAIELLKCCDERNRLAKNAFSLVKEKYSFEALTKSRVGIISALLN